MQAYLKNKWLVHGSSSERSALANLSTTLVLGVFVALLTWFTHTDVPSDQDTFNYTTSVIDFDISKDQPHAPGAPVYTGLGKLLAQLGMDTMRALQLLASLGAALYVISWYRTFLHVVPERTAIVAALVLALTPAVWLSGTQAMSDSLALGMLAFAQWQIMEFISNRRPSNMILAAAITAIALGIRPQFGPYVLCMTLVMLFVVRLDWKLFKTCFLLAAGIVAVWFVATLAAHAHGDGNSWFTYFAHLQALDSHYEKVIASESLFGLAVRVVMHIFSMGYFGAGLSVWYPESAAQLIAPYDLFNTPLHPHIPEWRVSGTILFAVYCIGAVLVYTKRRQFIWNRKITFLMLMALFYIVVVLPAVPQNTRFTLALLPLLVLLPVAGITQSRLAMPLTSVLVLAAVWSLSNIASLSHNTPPVMWSAAQQLNEAAEASDKKVHAILTEYRQRYISYYAPTVHIPMSTTPEVSDVQQWLKSGDRVFVSSNTPYSDPPVGLKIVSETCFERPISAWLRHTSICLRELKPD